VVAVGQLTDAVQPARPAKIDTFPGDQVIPPSSL
jgi:hypothetical protein